MIAPLGLVPYESASKDICASVIPTEVNVSFMMSVTEVGMWMLVLTLSKAMFEKAPFPMALEAIMTTLLTLFPSK